MSVDPPRRVWQRMLSGRRLDLVDPSPLDVEIVDIAHGLGRVARWNGQTSGPNPLSVAQHSLFVEEIAVELEPGLGPRARLTVLLHDAPEYVVGDLISPFKAVLGDSYKDIERRLLAAVHRRFGLAAEPPPALARLIKRADRASAFVEAVSLAGFAYEEACRFFGEPEPAIARRAIAPMPPEEATERYLARFHALWDKSWTA